MQDSTNRFGGNGAKLFHKIQRCQTVASGTGAVQEADIRSRPDAASVRVKYEVAGQQRTASESSAFYIVQRRLTVSGHERKRFMLL